MRPTPTSPSRPRQVLTLLAISLFAALSGAGPAIASDMRNHRIMTDQALRSLGWTDEAAIALTADYSQATDLGRIPGRTVQALQFGIPNPASQVPPVQSLAETASFNEKGTSGFHFNHLYSFGEIAVRWEELDAWSLGVAERLGGLPPEERNRLRPVLFGLVAHAVQDFYCHSNWVGILTRHLPAGQDPTVLPLWEELVGEDDAWRAGHPQFPSLSALKTMMISDVVTSRDEHAGGLQTGKPRVADMGPHAPWGHRHKGGREMEVVHDLGTRATARWIARLDAAIESTSESAPQTLATR